VTKASGRPAARNCRTAATAPGSGCHDTVSTHRCRSAPR
jgi:hypothetical protein